MVAEIDVDVDDEVGLRCRALIAVLRSDDNIVKFSFFLFLFFPVFVSCCNLWCLKC